MTRFLGDPAAARAWCAERRGEGRSIGFVPTMGALHAGHLALVRRAAEENDLAVASVFVNPLQFDDPGDLERYPRDLEGDRAKLEGARCALVFTGTLASFFPGELDEGGRLRAERWIDPGPCAAGLEGAHRPGHFDGVATIVARLFELVAPRRAYFGQKDFQQSLVVRELARRMRGPEVVVCPTVREPSGLAMSSRNELLSDEERERATALWRALRGAERAWRDGVRSAARLRERLHAALDRPGIELEYGEVRDPERWTAEEPAGELERAVALVAARLGRVRLIDNHVLHADALDSPR